jgi:hypothetical protein
MKRWTTAIGLVLPPLAAILIALAAGVARADECPNKFDEPKDILGVGDTKGDAETAYKNKIADYVKDQAAECKKHKCKGKKQCTPIHVETPPKCSESKDKEHPGWGCTGKFRGGCFCLTAAEKPGGAVPTPPGTATPPETASECENKFGDQVDILGIGDNDTNAKAAHTKSLKERIDAAAKECSEKKCPDGSNQCRMYYTSTDPKCEANPDTTIGGSICKSKFRSGCFCLGAKETLLASLLGPAQKTTEGEYAAAPERPYHGKTMLVGLVVARGCVAHEPCTAHLVANPKSIPETPDMVVEEERVPEHRDAHGHATLHGMIVASKQAKRQPADGPVTFTPSGGGGEEMMTATETATAMTFDVALADKPDEPVDVPIENLPPVTEEHRHKHASAPPVIPDSGICVVHDKLSGNGHATRISMNGNDVPVFVESPSVVAFRPRDAAQTGKNEFTITDEGTAKTYEAWDPALAIDANQNTLEQNQSTQFHVRLTGLGGMPEQCWASTEEGAAGEGYITLTIKNDSPERTKMSDGNVIVLTLHKADIVDGSYTYTGTITAGDQPGPFELDASIESHLAEAPPTRIAHGRGGPIAKGAPIGCCQYWNPASGNWCADETAGECLGTWMGTSVTCHQSGQCK